MTGTVPATMAATTGTDTQGSAQASLSSLEKQVSESNEKPIKKEERTPIPTSMSCPSGNSGDTTPQQSRFAHIQKSMTEDRADVQEKLHDLGRQSLQKLVDLLKQAKGDIEAHRILRSIEDMQSQIQPERTLIGVLGSTGVGKSSVINALLGEEKLLPTNCMRACTAVATEVAWNNSNGAGERYKAEIEFISADSWRCELEHLFADLLNVDGTVCRDASNRSTEAGIAWAKIKSIYPHHTKETLVRTNAECLAAEAPVHNLLGTTQHIKADSADSFQVQIQEFVDSKDRLVAQEDLAPTTRKPAELWPLIRVVRIFTKAEVLSKGVVLVDLPGCCDANEARSTVAEKYMGKCAGFWVVAPITRAVDDRAAEKLLGDSFRMQLKYDGSYDRVTVICSKTDDMDVFEAAESLGLRDELAAFMASKDKSWSKIKQQETELGEQYEAYNQAMAMKTSFDDQLITWAHLAGDQAKGKTVYAPRSQKRKRASPPPPPPAPANQRITGLRANNGRRLAGGREFFGILVDNDEDENSSTADDGALAVEEPLTEDQIRAKLELLHSDREAANSKAKELGGRIRELQVSLIALEFAEREREGAFRAVCVRKRNEYSRATIKEHFARGVRDMDQETEMRNDESSFDPAQSLRDYDEVARSLPVFCISSRVYRQLMLTGGTGLPESADSGFAATEDTEIPQLRAHAMAVAESPRRDNYRRFFNGLLQVLGSLHIWATSHTISEVVAVDPGQLAALSLHLTTLQEVLLSAAKKSAEDCKIAFQKTLFHTFHAAVCRAARDLPDVVEKWAAQRDAGGLSPNTYKAAAIRGGVFRSATAGNIDFNEDLAMPLKRNLARPWEETFATILPRVLKDFTTVAIDILESFHAKAQAGFRDPSRVQLLHGQLETYIQGIRDTQSRYLDMVNGWRREASRAFNPCVKSWMMTAYSHCRKESGRGCVRRMQGHIYDRIADPHAVLRATTENVQKMMLELYRRYEEELVHKMLETVENVRADYTNNVMGNPVFSVPEGVCAQVAELLVVTDAGFAALLTSTRIGDDVVDG